MHLCVYCKKEFADENCLSNFAGLEDMLVLFNGVDEGIDACGGGTVMTKKYFAKILELLDEFGVSCWCLDFLFTCCFYLV